MKNKILFGIIFAFAFIGLIQFVSADRIVNFPVFLGITEDNGILTQTSTAITGVSVKGYVCTNADCSSIGIQVLGLTANSGSSNIATVSFPTMQINSNGYVLYFYKTGYIGLEQKNVKVSGTGSTTYPSNIYLSQKRNGNSTIANFSVPSSASTGTLVPFVGIINSAIKDSHTSGITLNSNEKVNTVVRAEIRNSTNGSVPIGFPHYFINYSKNATVNFDWNFTTPGTYNITLITSIDTSENKILNKIEQRATRTIIITSPDRTLPVFVNLTNQTIFDNQSLSYQINATDASNISCYTVDNSSFRINCSGLLVNQTRLNIGSYRLNISVNDTLNNRASAIMYVNVLNSTIIIPPVPSVNNTAPNITARNVTTTNQSAQINLTLSVPGNVTIRYGTTPSILSNNATNSSYLINQSINLPNLLANTTYFYNVTLCNNLSNCSTFGTFNFTTNATIIIPPAIPAPTITLNNVSYLTNITAIVDLEFSEDANVTIRGGNATTNLSNTIIEDELTTDFDFQLRNLTQNTTYYYNVTLCGNSSNCATYGPFNFTTTAVADNTAPTITNRMVDVTDDSAEIELEFSEEANVTIRWGNYSTNLNNTYVNTIFRFSSFLRLENLSINTAYFYNVTLCDAVSNCATYGPFNFVTNDTMPVLPVCTDDDWTNITAPLICPSNEIQTLTWIRTGTCFGGVEHPGAPATENVSCSYIPIIPPTSPNLTMIPNVTTTNQSALINLSISEPANVTIRYGTNPSILSNNATNSSYLINQSINLPNLLANTTYFYNVTVCNNLSNCSTFGTFNFTTNSTITSPPIIPPSNVSIITIIEPPVGYTSNLTSILITANSTQMINWTLNVTGSLDSFNFTNSTPSFNFNYTLVVNTNGTYNIFLFGSNENGTANATRTFIVDTSYNGSSTNVSGNGSEIAPNITINTPLATIYNLTSIWLNASSDQQIINWSYILNNDSRVNFIGNNSFNLLYLLNNLTNSTYNLTVFGTNINGTTANATRTFEVNTSYVAPVIPACTADNWLSSLSPATCPSNELQTRTWSKVGNCIGNHILTETITCDYDSGGGPSGGPSGSTIYVGKSTAVSGAPMSVALNDTVDLTKKIVPLQSKITHWNLWLILLIILIIVAIILLEIYKFNK